MTASRTRPAATRSSSPRWSRWLPRAERTCSCRRTSRHCSRPASTSSMARSARSSSGSSRGRGVPPRSRAGAVRRWTGRCAPRVACPQGGHPAGQAAPYGRRRLRLRSPPHTRRGLRRAAEVHASRAASAFRRLAGGRGAVLVERDELVGYHLEQAVLYEHDLGRRDEALAERAGARLAIAGRRALSRTDYRAARDLLSRSVALTGSTRLDVQLEVDLSMAYDGLGENRRAIDLANAVADRAQAAGDEAGEALARLFAAHSGLPLDGGGGVDQVEALGAERAELARAACRSFRPRLRVARAQHRRLPPR